MKNWADHCSSDEEDLDDNEVHNVHEGSVREDLVESHDNDDNDDNEHVAGDEDAGPPPKKEYDWPLEPPFTAYVGNLAYSINEPSMLADSLVQLAKDTLQTEVTVVDARLARSRGEPQRHRGFGYVQFETLEQLKAVVEGLVGAKIGGRPIQLDTANQSYVGNSNNNNRRSHANKQSFPDGSKFRGGRFNNTNRNDGNRSDNRRRNDNDGTPAQRPSLKLQPRSNKGSDKGAAGGGSASNIFGGGKARDEQSWRDRRKSETTTEGGGRRSSNYNNNNNNTTGDKNNNNNTGDKNNNRRTSGRGGAGGRGGGRRHSERGNKHEHEKKEVPKKTPAAVEPEKPKKPAAPVNKFAALGFDSDSD